MVSENKVLLIGNLTREPELRYTPNGQAVAGFTIAVNRRYKNNMTGETVEKTDFIPVEVWRKQAESCKQYLTKGSSVYVEGRLQTDSWEAEDGSKRSKLKVVAQRVQFLNRAAKTRTDGEKVAVSSEAFEPDSTEMDGDVPF